MNDKCEQTLQLLGARSSRTILAVTMFIVLLFVFIPRFFGFAGGFGMLIPPVHYLSRELLRQPQRITDLERRLAER